jgi:hypothetical protein
MTKYKLVAVFFSFLFFSSCYYAKKKPELHLSIEDYDFGEIKTDSIYTGSVIITNSGNAPLVIDDINPGCGCTSVNVTKNIILPEDTCLLNFSYNTRNKKGFQENYIILTTNTDSVVHLLQINAYVD